MKALTTAGLTKLIQLIKSSFIKTTDTVTTNTVTLATVATSGSYNDLSNTPTVPTVDQTYDGTSTNAQSGVAIEGELSLNYQSKLVSGTNIKTINNTSILGSGDIDTSEIFVAEYGVTSYTDITTAINNGKLVLCTYNGDTYYYIASGGGLVSFVINTVGTNYLITVDSSNNWTNDSRAFPTKTSDLTNDSGYITGITSSDVTTALTYTPADTDLSNLSSTGKTVIDGQWVGNSTTVVEGLQLNTSTNISYTLPVPNDGYKYEVILTCTVESTATSGQQTAIYLSSTEMPYAQCVARAMPRSAASVTAGGSIIIPIGTDRKLTVVRTTTFYGTGYIYLRGYRRIGSNT